MGKNERKGGVDMNWTLETDGRFTLYQNNLPIFIAYAFSSDCHGRMIDTRGAEIVSVHRTETGIEAVFRKNSDLLLKETLMADRSMAFARCAVLDANGDAVETNDLVPLVMCAKSDESPYIWRDLQGKFLQIPYDNDMWSRYEAVAFLAGKKSADMTVLISEETREGILIGATEFDVWKNALACSGFDCRTLEARCGKGACDESTHDRMPHASMVGTEVQSSEFVIMYGNDYRDLLESYGKLLSQRQPIRRWDGGIPFGYNTYAARGIRLNEENYRQCGGFLREGIMPLGFENNGTTYVNLDGGWREMDRAAMLKVKDEYLAAGQQAGIYDSPFAYWGKNLDAIIPNLSEKHTFREIVLKNEKGEPLHPLDTAYAYDVTHPVWKEWTEKKAASFIEWGFSYLKVDFMSHAGLEGRHWDPAVRTGRQALRAGYAFLSSLFDEERIGRQFFISLSIAPLFPNGYGNARRFSCDCFGLSEDIEYALNALTWCWWHCGRLYQFNDPDHVVLYKAFTMLRESTESEARARYTTAAISGGILLLSDDYDQEEARERTLKFATNRRINRIAASGIAFRPVESAGGSSGHVFTAVIEGKQYVAVFNWNSEYAQIKCRCDRAGIPNGTYTDLWTGKQSRTTEGVLTWDFDSTGAVLLMLEDR